MSNRLRDLIGLSAEALFLIAIMLMLGVVIATIGCASAHATPAKSFDVPTIIIHEPVSPLAEEAKNRADANPPAASLLVDTLAPPRAAVKIDANTYRACTCDGVCRCANCPADCNTIARGDCPGGVCMVPMGRPQRSVIAKSSPVQASSDCAASGGVRGKVRAVGSKAWNGLKGAGKFVVRRFRR